MCVTVEEVAGDYPRPVAICAAESAELHPEKGVRELAPLRPWD